MSQPVGYEKVEHALLRNHRVKQRFDELLRAGKLGHDDILFCIVREECEAYYNAAKAYYSSRADA